MGYVQRGTDGVVGWNATVGEDTVCEHIVPSMWGWNARGASKLWLAVEFAQSTADKPISDGQVRAFVWWFQNVAKVVYPNLPDEFVMHSELSEGVADGKTDVFPRGDPRGDELRTRILAQMAWFRSTPA